MEIKQKWVIIFEAVFILIFISLLINSCTNNTKTQRENDKKLLSPKVYADLQEPKSFLIVNFSPLQQKIQDYINSKNLNISVYVKNLRNGASMGINEKEGYFSASLNKLPVAILIMEKIENKNLNFDTMLNVSDSDRDNTSGELYKTKEKQLPLRFVLEKMLKDSDNTAFRILLEHIKVDDLGLLLDYYDINLYANYHTKKSPLPKNDDYISPKLMSNVFSSLYFSTVLEPQDSQYILSLLRDTAFDIKNVTNLPDNVIVVQKFGQYYKNNSKFFHSCGILYIDESRIFYCVMTKDLSLTEAKETVGLTVNEIYNYVVYTRTKLNKYKDIIENS